MTPLGFGRSLLTGIAQIWLQPSPWTGLLFLASLAVVSWPLALGALIGVFVGSLVGLILRVPAEDIEAGLMGFSPALVGAGTWLFFDVNARTTVMLVGGAALAAGLSVIEKRLLTVPAYTSPFVFVFWVVLYLGFRWGEPAAVSFWFDEGIHLPALDAIGQVMFAGSAVAGVLVLGGLAIGRWEYAVAAAVAALVAWGITEAIDLFSTGDIEIGLFGFNAALTAVGLLATGRRWIVAGLGALIAFVIHAWIAEIGLIALTVPFVFAMWIFDLIDQHRDRTQIA